MSRTSFTAAVFSKLDIEKINTLGGVMQDVCNRTGAKRDPILILIHSNMLAAMHLDMVTAILLRVDQAGLINLINFELTKQDDEALFYGDEAKSPGPNKKIIIAAAAHLHFIYKRIVQPLAVINARLQFNKLPTVSTPCDSMLSNKKDRSFYMQFKYLLDCYDACMTDPDLYKHEMKCIEYMLSCLTHPKRLSPLDAINTRLAQLDFAPILARSATGIILEHEPDLRTFLEITHLLDLYEGCLKDDAYTPEEVEPLKSMIGCLNWSDSFCPAMPLTPNEITNERLNSSQAMISRLISGTLLNYKKDVLDVKHKTSIQLDHYRLFFCKIDRSQTTYSWPTQAAEGAAESKAESPARTGTDPDARSYNLFRDL